ncbi:patatin-like phospholipase family protein [Laceyella tengchongensis]|jgi:NTE family protein
MWADAVFEGGGVKGIGLVGALSVAESKGYKWKKVAGTSAGSIIAALLAAGYTGKELYEILMEQEFLQFLAPSWYDYIPVVGPALRLWLKKGLYPTTELEKWISDLLKAKGIQTFKDLPEGVELHVIASDISRSQLLVLPQDLKQYGYDPESFPVAKAVCMSCSIPFFFEPVKLMHYPTRKTSYVVDGGVLSNFPVWLFDQDNPRWPTFGFSLCAEGEEQIHQIDGPLSMFRSLLYTMLDARDNRYVQQHEEIRTIQVPISGVKMTDFSLSKEKKEELFMSGVKAAEFFFNKWSFDQYLSARGKSKQITYKINPSDQAGG